MRLIDADAYIKYCEEHWIPLNIDAVEEQPTIEAEPVRRGKNICDFAKGHVEFKCSLCGATLDVAEGGDLDGGYFKYCPNCGARMEEENETD